MREGSRKRTGSAADPGDDRRDNREQRKGGQDAAHEREAEPDGTVRSPRRAGADQLAAVRRESGQGRRAGDPSRTVRSVSQTARRPAQRPSSPQRAVERLTGSLGTTCHVQLMRDERRRPTRTELHREIRRMPGRHPDTDEIDRDRDLARHLVVEPPATLRPRRSATRATVGSGGNIEARQQAGAARARAGRRAGRRGANGRNLSGSRRSPSYERGERQEGETIPTPAPAIRSPLGIPSGRSCASTIRRAPRVTGRPRDTGVRTGWQWRRATHAGRRPPTRRYATGAPPTTSADICACAERACGPRPRPRADLAATSPTRRCASADRPPTAGHIASAPADASTPGTARSADHAPTHRRSRRGEAACRGAPCRRRAAPRRVQPLRSPSRRCHPNADPTLAHSARASRAPRWRSACPGAHASRAPRPEPRRHDDWARPTATCIPPNMSRGHSCDGDRPQPRSRGRVRPRRRAQPR